MTPPDSDAAICRACRDGDHDNCVIANYRYTQPGPGCACPCPIEQPDSDAREVCLCGHPWTAHTGHTHSQGAPESSHCAICYEQCPVGYRLALIELPLSLAQRILAALEGRGAMDERYALAAELRERLPR